MTSRSAVGSPVTSYRSPSCQALSPPLCRPAAHSSVCASTTAVMRQRELSVRFRSSLPTRSDVKAASVSVSVSVMGSMLAIVAVPNRLGWMS